ncbi:MAG TPA: porin, partial [Roseiarcus sp.]|nr:porin [Roseiarcus sp.]
GWGIDAGVKVNLPSLGAGDDALLTGSYTQSAFWYSGIPDMMWGENGQWNGNGQALYASDAYFNPWTNQWSNPTAWSISALFEHHFTPQFYVDLEGSVAGVHWSNQGGCSLIGLGCLYGAAAGGAISPSATLWLIGADIGWNPVTNLNFDLELMYADTNQSRPNGFLGTYDPSIFNVTTHAYGVFFPGAWEGNSSGFAGRLRITRYF